ncbi:MAG: hypothetical protein KAU44_06855, partial [Candidatus Marinimicrobia bacterium]|nr:hypothetical protein [Candidatus Neomarinimicrobiota bacterium]
LDWEEWPVEHGAPYYDMDNDGVYTYAADGTGDLPGIAQADQVLWYVVNDYSRSATTGLYGSLPIGIELQTTLWAYNQPGVRLGQIIFKSNKIINKSGRTITDMYVSQWADPDLGSYSNDFVGCDTVLSLGYSYNGEITDTDYDAFDLAPAAFGYDFFQGPMVESAGDTAIFELDYVPGYKNLPMTSFGWFSAGAAIEDPTLGEYEGTLQVYNLIRGYVPTEFVDAPTPWYLGNDPTDATTVFPLSGDPVAGTGDLDGTRSYFDPGDRRMCLSSGPFTFEAGDVQEVVVAVLGGLGANNLGSVTDLKLTDAVAQTLFDGLFLEVPKPPASPDVTVRPFEDMIVLEWGSDPVKVAAVEEPVVSGYAFEGYTVYQLPNPSATKDQATRIATYDIDNGIKLIYENRTPNLYEGEEVSVPICYGSDSGIERYIIIDWDYINNASLYEGSTYYFAVTAYNQNHDPGRLAEKAMESSMIILAVMMQEPLPGTALNAEILSDVDVDFVGVGDGQVAVTVVDPFAITGHDYSITFSYNADSSEVVFGVTDETDGVMISSGNSQLASLTDKGAPLVDGLEIKVSGPAMGLKTIKEYDADGVLVDPRVSIIEYSLGSTGYILSNRGGDYNQAPYFRDFDRFNQWGLDDLEIDFTESSVSWIYASDALLSATEKVPFSVYRYNFATGLKERLYVAIMESDATVAKGMGVWDTTGVDGLFHKPAWEPIYAYVGPTSYDPAQEAAYIAAANLSSPPSNTGWTSTGDYWAPFLTATVFVDYLGGGVPIGNKIYFATNKTIQLTDEYTFTTAGLDPTSNDSLMALAIDKINVFPNPYYAYNALATTPYDQ